VIERKAFHGVWVQTITPIGEKEDLLIPTIKRQYNLLSKSAVQGIIPLGPIGEFASLTFEEKRTLLRTLGQEGGRMLIMPQIGDTSIHNVLQLAGVAESAGCDAVCIIPPFYYPTTDETLYTFFQKIFENVKVPVLLYNQESYAKVPLSLNLLKKLKGFSHFYGVIDGGKNINYVSTLRQLDPELIILSNRDRFHVQWLELGTNGMVSWLANAFPWVFTQIYQFFRENRQNEALALQQKVSGLRDLLRMYPYPASLKYAMYQSGYPAMRVRTPLENLKEEQRTQLKTEISRYLQCSKILELPGCELIQ
jgi:dihydrodipicolinate synthase/N-acetylneuraminate lyase